MSASEVAHRVGAAIRLRWRAHFASRPRPAPPPQRWSFGQPWFDGCVQDEAALRGVADAVSQGRLHVLGLGRVELGMPPAWRRDVKTGTMAPLRFGPAMDLTDPALVGDIKYLWEPSRHHDLVPLTQAWRAARDAHYLDAAVRLVDSWIDQNPHPRGPHWSSSLECGIRLINWAIAWHLLDAGDMQGELRRRHPGFVERWLDAVYWHLHFVRHNLSAHSSANNHLIGELAGLFIGLCTWRCWPAIDGWRADAQRRLAREALLQNAPDGVNREQASAYQLFVFEFLVVAGLCARAQATDFEPVYWQRIDAMCSFVAAITDAGGHMPQIGDADDGLACGVFVGSADNAHSLLAVGALLFGRGELARAAGALDAKTMFWLGPQAAARFAALRDGAAPLALPQWFPQGGYAVLGSDPGTPREIRIVFDAGPLGYLGIAAHGHADALSMLLSVAGEPLLVDVGTYCYHGALAWREHFRSTRAHNTVEIDGQSQSRSGGRFMWMRHANARLVKTEHTAALQVAVGEHDGYARRGQPLTHRRSVRFDASAREIEITDELIGEGVHDLALRWHTAPGVAIARDGSGYRLAGRLSELRIVPAAQMSCEVVTASEASPQGWVSPGYERKLPSSVIECTLRGARVPCTLVTRMSCGDLQRPDLISDELQLDAMTARAHPLPQAGEGASRLPLHRTRGRGLG
jgi:hypothetical protein